MSSNKRTNWKYLQLEFLSILSGSETGPYYMIYLALSPTYHQALNDDLLVIPDNCSQAVGLGPGVYRIEEILQRNPYLTRIAKS